MALEPGARLGPYEIVAALGAGGMGEVYRARDTRLDRSVAIKVMPPHIAEQDEARQRFEREARAISSLAHPHICSLHDVGSQDGVDFLVMELVDGESLAARLTRGPLPLAEALRLAAQIADALDRAHRQGIVHRDLKPANVMLSRGGAKLLDFGLARQLTAGPVVGAGSQAATRAMLTAEGTLLGTLHYMAPEQLEGRQADARADLFALGATLHEMVTGQRAFDGETPASVISAILRDRPPPVSSRAPLAPYALDRLVESCLAKDPEERWQSAHDARLELLAIAASPAVGASSAEALHRRPSRWWLAAGLATGLAAGAVGTATWLGRNAPSEAPLAVRFEIPPPAGAGFPETLETVSLALSPDGSQLAFVASLAGAAPQIWLRPLTELVPRPLGGTEKASSLFWSYDGRAIGFFADGRLKRLELAGGAPVVLCEVPAGAGLAGSWGRDAILFGSVTGTAIYRLPASGGSPTVLIEPDPSAGILRVAWPSFLPDGERFVYTVMRAEGKGSELWLAGPDGERRRVAATGSRAEVMGAGFAVFSREGALLAQRLDAERGELVGAPTAIAPEVFSFGATMAASFATSRSGSVAFAAQSSLVRVTLYDGDGRVLVAAPEPIRGGNTVSVSLDGRRAMSDRRDRNRVTLDVWMLDLERWAERPVTEDPGTEAFGIFLPDGRSILYSAEAGLAPLLYHLDLATGARRRVLAEERFQAAVGVSPDGSEVLFRERQAHGGFELFTARVADGVRQPVLRPGQVVATSALSPDGELVAYVSAESGRPEVYLRSLGEASESVRVSLDGAELVSFAPDGRTLYFTSRDRKQLLAAAVTARPVLSASTPQARFALPGLGWKAFAVTPDGRFLAVARELEASVAPLTVITGWAPSPSG